MSNARTILLIAASVAIAACGTAPTMDDSPVPGTPRTSTARVASPAAIEAPTPVRDGTTPLQPRPAREVSPPYFSGDAAGLFVVLPPAPGDGDARDEADRRIFRETRKLEGTPRWQMAAADAELGAGQMLEHFSCSLDIELTPQQAPRLVALLQKVTREAAQSMGRAKEFYKRHRPFLADEGNTCVARSTVGTSYDYPSGHTTAGWAWGLVLAQANPTRATPILARARAIGDSRVVCGVHNASAVENARMLTGAAVAVISASPQYQQDLAAARAELEALRAVPHAVPVPQRCAAEAELVKSFW